MRRRSYGKRNIPAIKSEWNYCWLFILLYIIVGFSISSSLSAKTLYLSSSNGDDNFSVEQAQYPNTPWKTIDKLNTSMGLIDSGDSILFMRGDVFFGQIVVNRSGTKEDRIFFGAYGEGEYPRISARALIVDWTIDDNNLWKANHESLDGSVANFFIDNKSCQIGRYPNLVASNQSFFNIDSHHGSVELSSNSLLDESTDWTGSDVIVRTRRWIYDKCRVQSHIGNTIVLGSPTFVELEDNFGFFFQNHLSTLDQKGEWFYDKEEGVIFLYIEEDPNAFLTEASYFKSALIIDKQQYINIEGLEFCGSSENNLLVVSSNNIVIRDNVISEAGCNGVKLVACDEIVFENNTVSRANNSAIIMQKCNSIELNYNFVEKIGLRPGMAPIPDQQYIGIVLEGNDINCLSNIVEDMGYIGINFHGDNILVKNNIVRDFCYTLGDGGGIYTSGDGVTVSSNRLVEGNIVLNGIGAPFGTDNLDVKSAQGIHLDDRSENVTVQNNIVADCKGIGIYARYAHDISILGNTTYNNTVQLSLQQGDLYPELPIRRFVIQNNIFYSVTNSQKCAKFITTKDDISEFGTFDYNYYCKPINEPSSIHIAHTVASGYIEEVFGLETWNSRYPHDVHSNISPYELPIFSLGELNEINLINNGKFEENIFGWNCWSSTNDCNVSHDVSSILDSSCLKLISSASPENHTTLSTNVDGFDHDSYYMLKFTLLSTHDNEDVEVSIQNGEEPFERLALSQHIKSKTNRKEYELLFAPEKASNSSYVTFEFSSVDATFWLDNVELLEAQIIMESTIDSLKWFYNAGELPLDINDDAFYICAKGEKYHNPTIEPFESLILLKVTEEYYNGIVSLPEKKSILVYPSPTSTILNILTNDFEEQDIIITDILGRVYLKTVIINGILTLDVSNYSPGIYIIRLSGDDDNGIGANFIVM